MHQNILLSLAAFVIQASASPALPLPAVLPAFSSVGIPPVTGLPLASLPSAGTIPPPVLLTSIPGAVPTLGAPSLPSLPAISPPSAALPTGPLSAPTGLPEFPELPIPSEGLPSFTLPGGSIPAFPTGLGPSGLPTGFPALPTLTNSALISSISAALNGITLPTGLPLPSQLPLSYTSSLGGLTSLIPVLPIPSLGSATGIASSLVQPASIIKHLSSAIEILLLLIQLIQETINTGGVRVPGVAELGIDVGTNLLGVLLKVAADFLDKAGAVGAIAF